VISRRRFLGLLGITVQAGSCSSSTGVRRTTQTCTYVASGEDLGTAVANAGTNSRLLLEPRATFDINAPIPIASDNLTIDGQGAFVGIGSAPTDETALSDLIFRLTGTDQTIENINFVSSATGNNSDGALSANVRLEGVRGVVRACTFSTGSVVAVACIGSKATANKILRNQVFGSGVTYSWDGASTTVVSGNTINNAPENALSGTGNHGATSNKDCWILDNTIINCGRMAIEDWGLTERTIIRGNRINGCVDIGISAVGRGALIEGNTVVSADGGAIEFATNGIVCRGNTINHEAPTLKIGAAIQVNSTHSPPQRGALISGNMIHNPAVGIWLIGDIDAVNIVGNVFTDTISSAIEASPTSSDGVTISGNTFWFNTPASYSWGRAGIAVLTPATVTGNVFHYTTASAGGSSVEYPIRAQVPSIITGNVIDGGGRTDAQKPRVSTYGDTVENLVIVANHFRGGATLDRTNMVTPSVANNVTF
jgi:hypothetical protein